jgi:hypothetical protein
VTVYVPAVAGAVTVIDATPVELAVAVATEPPTRNVTTAPGQKPVALSGSDPPGVMLPLPVCTPTDG